MEIKEYTKYDAAEIRQLYEAVGWVAYTKDMDALMRGYANSLLVLGACENGALIGILRAVGDGYTVVLVQDILVLPEKQRQGVGTALVKAALARFPEVRQIQLTTDDRPETAAFYRSLGFSAFSDFGLCGFMRG